MGTDVFCSMDWGLGSSCGQSTNYIFNYYSFQDASTETQPAMRATFSDNVTQWIIYDSYKYDSKLQEQDKEKIKKDKTATGLKKLDFHKKLTDDKKDVINSNIVKKALILERMINQNMFSDILHGMPSEKLCYAKNQVFNIWNSVILLRSTVQILDFNDLRSIKL